MLIKMLLIVTGFRNLSEAIEKKTNAVKTRNQIRLFKMMLRNLIRFIVIVLLFFPLSLSTGPTFC